MIEESEFGFILISMFSLFFLGFFLGAYYEINRGLRPNKEKEEKKNILDQLKLRNLHTRTEQIKEVETEQIKPIVQVQQKRPGRPPKIIEPEVTEEYSQEGYNGAVTIVRKK